MTDLYYFDTDCLSAFLWVHKADILEKLYSGRIIIPSQVYTEISRVPPLKSATDGIINDGAARTESLMVGSEEFEEYLQLTGVSAVAGKKVIGKGEASCIAMAKFRGGVLASNNMKDISCYVEEYGLKHVTTGTIMKQALDGGIITESEGNSIWSGMLRKKRMLPAATFTDFLRNIGR